MKTLPLFMLVAAIGLAAVGRDWSMVFGFVAAAGFCLLWIRSERDCDELLAETKRILIDYWKLVAFHNEMAAKVKDELARRKNEGEEWKDS